MKKYVSVLALLLMMTLLCACGKQAAKPAFIPEGHGEDTVAKASFEVKDGEVLSGTFSLFTKEGKLLAFTYAPDAGCVLQDAAPAGDLRTTKTTMDQFAGALDAICKKVAADHPDKTLQAEFLSADYLFGSGTPFHGDAYSLSKGEFRAFADSAYDGSRDHGILNVRPGLDGSIVTFCLDE